MDGERQATDQHKTMKPSICFVALNAFNVIANRDDLLHVGGAEVQIGSLAQALAAKGYPIHFVTWDHGQPKQSEVNGFVMHGTCSRDDGMPILRFLTPRWSSLRRALAEANADVYMQGCADSLTGQVSHWCRQNRRKFCYLVMHDWDCLPRLPKLKTRRERVLYRYGLRHADAVIAQTQRQQELLKQMRCRSPELVRPVSANHAVAESARFPEKNPRVLWLGRFTAIKRIEWLLDAAARLPNVSIDLVGAANRDDGYSREIIKRASGLSNVTLCGAIPHDRVFDYYRQASVLALTSIDEGFPTVFMEAWSCGLPTVSTIDTDGLIERHGLGRFVRNVAELTGAIEELTGSHAAWRRCSESALSYFQNEHLPESAAARLGKIIDQLAAGANA